MSISGSVRLDADRASGPGESFERPSGYQVLHGRGVRLDALHLAAVQRVGPDAVTLVTADLREAQAARALRWHVLGT